MSQTQPQAWITYVTRSDQVPCAVVLAESLRRTGTTKKIGVITCKNVSGQDRLSLRNCFDHVFKLEEDENSFNSKHDDFQTEIKAKIFAFSLDIFGKCVFLEPNSLFLENADWLFERDGSLVPLTRNKASEGPSDYFLFDPCPPFSEYLGQICNYKNGWTMNGVMEYLESHAVKWMENNIMGYNQPKAALSGENESIQDKLVIRFSLKKGALLERECWGPPSIIQFVESPLEQNEFVTKLQSLQENSAVGLTEKAIIQTWLKLFEDKAAEGIPTRGKKAERFPTEPIAIIGISCRLPGANNLEEFWNLLYSGQAGVREPPSFRWKKEHSVTPVGKKERQTNAGFLSTTVDEFDAKFFGVSPKEAVFMDPQTRLMHEVMWESLENAGVDPQTLYGSHTGIFTGSWMNDYKDIVQWSASRDFFRTYMGNSIGAAAARLSFLLGATGPSIATESGCSSAIVALDVAVKSLRCGETNLALAGGVNLVLHPFTSNIMDYVIAPDGRCKTFDAKADGFGRGEGCGFLVLKRLSDALRDRDHIWAMIRGSAVTQEGISRSLGTPTVHCEALAMQLALKNAGVRPEQISFVETHGTGTAVGDPMEVAAIAKAYHSRNRQEPLVIGSVKTNVGHTESLSGITGIIKTILAMQHQVIPKHLNFETLNPDINLELVPAVIPLEPTPWPKIQGQPRFAGISSFGITGTDGHVILQEAPDHQLDKFTLGMERPLHILKLSAKTKEALDQLLVKYQEMLIAEKSTEDDFANVAYTANTGRASFEQRAFLLASDFQAAADAIQENKVVRAEVGESGRTICFLFTGQGSQYPGMARLLYEGSPVFRFHFDHCARTLQESYNVSLSKVLWETDPNSKELSRTIYSQTSIFCVEYCLLRLWESWGLKPDYVLGHSLGEFCAAVAAGMISFEDALRLVAVRSGLIDKLPRGSMLVLKANQKQVEEAMHDAKIELDFAAFNSEEQTVVAGDNEKVSDMLTYCKGKEIKGIILEATHAFHSCHMNPMLEDYRKVAQSITYREGTSQVQYISGMEGKVRELLDADYWVRHTREKVNFLEACKTLKEISCANFLEVGPQPVLSTFVLQNNEDTQVSYYPSLRKNTNDWETILTSLGKLWMDGYNVDWTGFDKPYLRKKVTSLPFYPFNRKSYWVECNDSVPVSIHPLIGANINNASSLSLFQNDLNVSAVPYLKDHCIGNRIVFPGAGFTEMCLSAGFCAANFVRDNFETPRQPVALENLRIEQPLELRESKFCRLQVIVDLPEKDQGAETNVVGNEEPDKPQGFRCKVFHRNQTDVEGSSSSSGKWVPHATATFHPVIGRTSDILGDWNGERLKELIESKDPMQMEGFYKRIDGVGLKFGETFRSIQRQWSAQQEDVGGTLDEIVAEIKVPQDHDKYLLHPVIIDAMFQAQILAGLRNHKSDALRVPVHVGKLILLNSIEESSEQDSSNQSMLYIHVKWTSKEKCTVVATTQDFVPLALMEDVELLETNVKTIQSVLEQQNSQIPDCWEEIWRPIHGPSDQRVPSVSLKQAFETEEFKQLLQAASTVGPEDAIYKKKVDRLVCLYTLRALFQLGWTPKLGEEFSPTEFCEKYKIKIELKKLVYFYFTMFQDELDMMEISESDKWKVTKIPYTTEDQVAPEATRLHEELIVVKSVAAVVKVYANVATSLSKILKSEINALSILFPLEEDKQELSAETYYLQHPGREELVLKVAAIVNAIVRTLRASIDEKNASKTIIRAMEVGAGTGSLSLTALEEMRKSFGNKFEYYYTDISASFFPKAEKRLEEFKQNIRFATFNVEENPLSQGIPINYFDMVFASDVLHATRNLKETLRNLRMTMRHNGTLHFTDTFTADKGITFLFGVLEGYWRFEDFDRRPHHTCVSAQGWEAVLTESGFSNVHSYEAYFGVLGTVISEASSLPGYDEGQDHIVRNLSQPEKKKRWIVFSPDQEEDKNLIMKLKGILEIGGCKVDVVLPTPELENEEDDKTAQIYSLLKAGDDEEVQGIIYGWGMNKAVQESKKFGLPLLHIAKYMLNEKRPPRLYIYTKDVQGITEDVNNPSPAILFGMAKSLKNENSDLIVRCVDLDGKNGWDTTIDQVLFELAMHKEIRERERMQVAYRGNLRYEPRFNRVAVQQKSQSDLRLPPSTDRYKLVLPQSRVINDLEFTVLEEGSVGENEVEVRTKAYALNFRDIFAILKPNEEFEKINVVGLDYSGVVTKVGGGVSKFKVGDKVFGANLKEEQLPSHLVTDDEGLFKIHDKMTFWEASTLPAVYATSIYCFVDVAKLQEGETVLIHTGSGGVGLSAIQVARRIGANIITTAGSPRKRAYLRSLGIEHVFHSRNTSYQEEIMKLTNGRGVDVVLNSITGPGFKEATLAVCTENARFIEMSKLSIWSEEEVKERRPDVQYSIVDLTILKREVWIKLQEKTKEYIKDGDTTVAIPFVKFDALRIRQAMQFFQKAKHIGKVVLAMPDVKTEGGQWKVKVNLFNADSTYLITGGLGGIGFEVCKWMLEKGATDIILIGRSPPKPEIAREIERLNKKEGVNVMVRQCDVGNFIEIKQLVDELTKTESEYKPLRGIQHCAGVLRDSMYDNQTWETFTATYNPKVVGTWNLHQLTKQMHLEHFVLYSSLTALVGTPGQANHASANCFEDAFAHYRYSVGLPATTINWGQWAEVGCAKEVNVTAVLPVSVARMLNGLEEVLRNQRLQTAFGEFESLRLWTIACPTFKYYLDEKLLKSLNDSEGHDKEGFFIQSTKFWQEIDEADTTEGKMVVVTSYMKAILRNALRMDPDDPIKDDANMQDLGVDSLMLIELRNSIQGLLGSRLSVTASMLKDCQTIRQLATVIVNKIEENEQEDVVNPMTPMELEELIREDCQLEESIRAEQPPGFPCSSVKTILVTGATGQMGPHIVSRLCQMNSLEKVICLIRTRESESPEDKLKESVEALGLTDKVDMNKVECLRGNVTHENFGLEKEAYDQLCDSVDAIIHLAIKSNYVELYRKRERGTSDIRGTNVGGTRAVLRFAATRKTKYVYYSGALFSVFGDNDTRNMSDEWPVSEGAHSLVAISGITGYPISKYVSEMLIKEANDRGIPCKVFRFPYLMGESQTGRSNYKNNSYVWRFLTYLKLKAMPSSPIPAVVLPVDICADLSIQLFFDDRVPCEIFNIAHPKPQLEAEFVNVAKQEYGIDVELVEWKNTEFVEKLYASDIPTEVIKEMYQDVDRVITAATSSSLQVIQGYLNSHEDFFSNPKLIKFMPDFANTMPNFMDIIKKDLNYVKSTGYFTKFGLK